MATELPPIDFSTFVVSIGSSVFVQLGGADGQAGTPDLASARNNIQILEMFEEKTRGNLTEAEQKLLSGVLYQARMACMDAARR